MKILASINKEQKCIVTNNKKIKEETTSSYLNYLLKDLSFSELIWYLYPEIAVVGVVDLVYVSCSW